MAKIEKSVSSELIFNKLINILPSIKLEWYVSIFSATESCGVSCFVLFNGFAEKTKLLSLSKVNGSKSLFRSEFKYQKKNQASSLFYIDFLLSLDIWY